MIIVAAINVQNGYNTFDENVFSKLNIIQKPRKIPTKEKKFSFSKIIFFVTHFRNKIRKGFNSSVFFTSKNRYGFTKILYTLMHNKKTHNSNNIVRLQFCFYSSHVY